MHERDYCGRNNKFADTGSHAVLCRTNVCPYQPERNRDGASKKSDPDQPEGGDYYSIPVENSSEAEKEKEGRCWNGDRIECSNYLVEASAVPCNRRS